MTSPNGEGSLVDIDPDRPWAAWPSPEAVPSAIRNIRIGVDRVYMPSGGARLYVQDTAGMVGYPTAAAIQDLSIRVGFPADFIAKLPLDLQAAVINSRIEDCRETNMTMTRQPYMVAGETGALEQHQSYRTVTNISPGWRGILPHGAVAQTAFNILASVYGIDGVSIKVARILDAGMEVRFQTNYVQHVTRKVGDVMSLGIKVNHKYGIDLAVSLYIERLICENGMTSISSAFEWKSRQLGTPASQIEWLMIGVANAIGGFDAVIEKARSMSAIVIEGDSERMLIERSRAMRLPRTFDEGLLSAWRQEPEPTEWGFLNAFTRFATHSPELNDRQRHNMQATAGKWCESFDMVNARMPRPLAEAVGASIYGED